MVLLSPWLMYGEKLPSNSSDCSDGRIANSHENDPCIGNPIKTTYIA